MTAVLGIRREDKHQWERRTPLTPRHVAVLVGRGVDVTIQPSDVRVFEDGEYREAGALVAEDLSRCDVVLAVKEIPAHFFRSGTTYVFFAHVCKGQPYNMAMLRTLMERRANLIDYERVTDAEGRRLIFFGEHAGHAGMLETLHALGQRLAWEGHSTPFPTVRRPLEYRSLREAEVDLERIAAWLATEGLPEGITPLIVGFAGYGNVSRGAQKVFDLLPVEEIAPRDLWDFMASGRFSSRKLYKVVFYEGDMVEPVSPGAPFRLQEYYHHPERYRGVFERYLPHLTVLVNAVYWDERYPRLVTTEWLRRNWRAAERPRLRVIGDISCDIAGAVECTVKATNPGAPTYVFQPADGTVVDGCAGDGPVVMAVDTLPSELPREASESFGDMLMPFLPELLQADLRKPMAELDLPPEMKRALIVLRGELTPDYRYLAEFLSKA